MFITFEGGEGSGKTSAIQAVCDYLQSKGYSVTTTREPGGTTLAEQLRACIMNYPMDREMESCYFAVARHIHLYEKIIPALERGDIVVCDRYVDSSYVYQGFMKNNFTDVYHLNKQFLTPDITFYLKVNPEVGLKRVAARKGEINRFDTAGLDYHKKIAEYYDECAKRFSNRIIIVDANRSKEEVTKDILAKLEERLSLIKA